MLNSQSVDDVEAKKLEVGWGLPLPLASLPEQRLIVAKVDALFAQADAIERAVEIVRRRAFRGSCNATERSTRDFRRGRRKLWDDVILPASKRDAPHFAGNVLC